MGYLKYYEIEKSKLDNWSNYIDTYEPNHFHHSILSRLFPLVLLDPRLSARDLEGYCKSSFHCTIPNFTSGATDEKVWLQRPESCF